MNEERPNFSLPLDLDKSTTEDDNVQLRRDSSSLRRARERSKERTPTMVVSDAFTFLNENHISIVDAIEEGTLQPDGGVPKAQQDEHQSLEKTESSDSVTDKKESPGVHLHLTHSDSCLPQAECHFSKDSGFASLERHLNCEELVNYHDKYNNTRNDLPSPLGIPYESENNSDNHTTNTEGSDERETTTTISDPLNSSEDLQSEIRSENDTVSLISEEDKVVLDSANSFTSVEPTSDINDNQNEDSETEPLTLVMSGEDVVNGDQSETEDIDQLVHGVEDVILRKPSITSTTEEVDRSRVEDSTVSRPSRTGLLLEANPSTELVSDDSSDEDTGIYAETFRRSNWVRVSQKGQPDHEGSNLQSPPVSSDIAPPQPSTDYPSIPPRDGQLSGKHQSEMFPSAVPRGIQNPFHCRSDSLTTTASEQEFKTRYMSRRKCLIQRADSQQEYHRLSARIYEEDKEVVVERASTSEDLGLHLLDSHPAYITSVDPDSPAEKAGIVEGQILVSVNDFNVLTTDHGDIIKLIQNCTGSIRLGVASTDFEPIRDLQAPVISGYMFKLGSNVLVRIWKKRFFVLRHDNCLYYYKSEQELDPLGALPLGGYTISRHTDTSREYCFKAEKYRARTYYFMTENRDQLTEWVAVLTDAAVRSKKQKESSSFMSVSSHNVSLPALDIRRPECSGYLLKLSPHSRTWRRRYCLLKDACIYYYKDVNSFSALGVAHLHGYTVDVEGHTKKKNSFSLIPPDPKMRQFCFGADNETDKKRWVESIIHSVQRWVPVARNSNC